MLEIARKYGLEVKGESIIFNESGLDFLVAYAEDDNGEASPDFLNKRVTFQVPIWSDYEDDLIAYKNFTGVPAGMIDLEIQNYVWEMNYENVRKQFHQSLAKTLASLHTVPKTEPLKVDLFVQEAEEVRESIIEHFEKVKAKFGVSKPLWNRW
ncbi:hypothetical protein B1R38_01240 [Bacillus cereus]|uniref:hypothetical protein n=1 Tax=Bacillus cereus TaxID=1396 RepID=UPI000D670293|nr:hypothetical protein [Bacillus cereus]PWE75318.1 hypothetical protein B1R38_01240 [Bacillus cereus]